MHVAPLPLVAPPHTLHADALQRTVTAARVAAPGTPVVRDRAAARERVDRPPARSALRTDTGVTAGQVR